MSGIHIVGDSGRFDSLLQTWARNGLQFVLHVKPEDGNGARLRELLPNGFLVGRLANNSDMTDSAVQQAYEANPAAAARWIVGRYLPTMQAQPQYNAWQFNNEPVFGNGETRRFRIHRLAEFTRHLIDLANTHGHGVALFAFARGTPEPDEWQHFYEVWRYALSKNASLPPGRKNILCLHQYGAFNRRGAGALFFEEDWHLKRYEKKIRPILPLDLQQAEYCMGEAGPDGGMDDIRGWTDVYGRDEAGRVACVMDWRIYNNEFLANQAGCKGAAFFTLGQEGGFGTFDIANDPIAGMFAGVQYRQMKPAATTTPPQPQPTPPPPQEPPSMTLTDRLAAALRAEFGTDFEDLRGKLPVHPTKRYSPIDSRGFDYIAWHHSETERSRTWANIAGYHVNTNDWAGIGYHGGIRQGKVALFDSVDTERAHVYGMNHEALGWCVTGRYDTMTLDERDLDAMKRVVKVCDSVYGHQKVIKGHGELRVGGYTACPGSDIKRVLPTLRQAIPQPPPLPYTDEERAKAKWFTEQLARTLRGDTDATATLISALISEPKKAGLHNALVAKAVPSLEKVTA